MATLQSFQVEIEDIRNRELAKARAQSQPEAPRKGLADQRSAPKVRKKTETAATSPAIPKFVNDESAYDLTDIEHSIEARHTWLTFILTYSHRIDCATKSDWRRHSGKRFNSHTPNPTRRGISSSTRRSPTQGTIIYR